MKINLLRRSWWIAAIALALVLALGAQTALASTGTFDVSVYHGINGRSLGLSKDLPVNITIQKDGELLTVIENFTFKSRIHTPLPSGEYLITVESVEAGPLPSMLPNAHLARTESGKPDNHFPALRIVGDAGGESGLPIRQVGHHISRPRSRRRRRD